MNLSYSYGPRYLKLYKIEAIMNGDLDELIDALITADTAEKLKAE